MLIRFDTQIYDYDSKLLIKMIRFDTFIFDHDTKNVIIFSNKIVMQPVRQALPYNVFLPGERIDSLNKSFHRS